MKIIFVYFESKTIIDKFVNSLHSIRDGCQAEFCEKTSVNALRIITLLNSATKVISD